MYIKILSYNELPNTCCAIFWICSNNEICLKQKTFVKFYDKKKPTMSVFLLSLITLNHKLYFLKNVSWNISLFFNFPWCNICGVIKPKKVMFERGKCKKYRFYCVGNFNISKLVFFQQIPPLKQDNHASLISDTCIWYCSTPIYSHLVLEWFQNTFFSNSRNSLYIQTIKGYIIDFISELGTIYIWMYILIWIWGC